MPFPAAPGDLRSPIHERQDQWLGVPLAAQGITDAILQRDIIRVLTDTLCDMPDRVVGRSTDTHVSVVDVRGTLPLRDSVVERQSHQLASGK
jgi:hypothetical protein